MILQKRKTCLPRQRGSTPRGTCPVCVEAPLAFPATVIVSAQVFECGIEVNNFAWDNLHAETQTEKGNLHNCQFAALLVSASETGVEKLEDIGEKLAMTEAAVSKAKTTGQAPGFMKTILRISSNALGKSSFHAPHQGQARCRPVRPFLRDDVLTSQHCLEDPA